MADIGYITIAREEYDELKLKAWKYDKLREGAKRKNIYADSYFPTEIDVYEFTSEEISEEKEKKRQQKKEREENEAF